MVGSVHHGTNHHAVLNDVQRRSERRSLVAVGPTDKLQVPYLSAETNGMASSSCLTVKLGTMNLASATCPMPWLRLCANARQRTFVPR